MVKLLRGSLRTTPGPGGAGSIGHFVQPCRKIILTYCNISPSSKGVRDWLRSSAPLDMARRWPQVEWVIREGKKSQEPYLEAHYVNQRSKIIPLQMFPATALQPKLDLALSATGRKLSGPKSTQGFNTSETRNYAKKPIEGVRGADPVRGHWSGFGSERRN